MYNYGQSHMGRPDPYYDSRDPYGYGQRQYGDDSRRAPPPSSASQSWYDMTENMASSSPSMASGGPSRPSSQHLVSSGGGGGADNSGYTMGQSQRSNTYHNSNIPNSEWTPRDQTAQAVAFLQNVDQKEKRNEDLENQKIEVQRLRQEVQKSMETLQHLKEMQDSDGNTVPTSPRYGDSYRHPGGEFSGRGGKPPDGAPPRNSGGNQAPRSILKKPRRPGEEDTFEDDRVRTNYCEICSIQFNTSREYEQHCAGLLHTKQLMQQKMGIPVGQSPAQGTGMSSSKGGESKMPYMSASSSSQKTWSEKDAENIKSAFIDYDYDYDESSGSQMSHFKASRYDEGGNVECKICDKKYYTFEELRNHAAEPPHCKRYLIMQASLGTDKFLAKYGDVPFTLPHKDTSGPGDRYIRTDLSQRDQMRYKEFLARSGTLNNWTCKICNANTFMMEHWLAHCCGKKHAKACMSKIGMLSTEDYLRTFGDIPGPAPSKAVDAKMIEKWETAFIIDALKKPPLMSNLQKEQIMKERHGESETPMSGPTTGLLGDFPADKDQYANKAPTTASPYSRSQQSPYSQSRDQSPYSGQSTSRGMPPSPYDQQQTPYRQSNPPQSQASSSSPYGQQPGSRGSGYGQEPTGYGQQSSPYGQPGRPSQRGPYDQEPPYSRPSEYDQRAPPQGSGPYGGAGRTPPTRDSLPYGQDAPHELGGQRPGADHRDSRYPSRPGDPYGNPYLQSGPGRDQALAPGPDYGGRGSRPPHERGPYPDRGSHDQTLQQRESDRDRSRDGRGRDGRDHRDSRDSRDLRDNRDRDGRDHHDHSHSRTSSSSKDKHGQMKSGMYDPFESDGSKGKGEEKEVGKEGVVSTTKALQMLHQLQEKQRLEQEKLEKQLKEQQDMLARQRREMEAQKRKHQEEIEKQNRQLQEEKKRLEDEKRREEQRRREKEKELEREKKLRIEEIRRQQQMKDDLERKRLQRQKEEIERKKLEKIREEQERKAREEKARQEQLAKQLRMKLELEQKLKEELEAKKKAQERKAEEERQKAEEMRRIREKEEELQRLLNAKKIELENKNKQNLAQQQSPWQRGPARAALPTPRYPGTPRNLVAVPRSAGPRPSFAPNPQFASPLVPIPAAVTPIPQVAPAGTQQQGDLVNSAPWNAPGAIPDPAKPTTTAPWNKGPQPNKNTAQDKNKGNNSGVNPPWGGGKKGGEQGKPPWAGKGPNQGKMKQGGDSAPWNSQGKNPAGAAPWKGRDNRRKEDNSGDRKPDDKDASREDMPWKRRDNNGRGNTSSPRGRRSGRDDRSRNRDDDRDGSRGRSHEQDVGRWRDNRDRERSRGRDSSERRRRRTPPQESDIAHEAPWHRKEGGEGFDAHGGRKSGGDNVERGAPWAARRPGDHRKPPLEPGHCYKLVLEERELIDWQMAQEDFIRCMDKGQNMDQPLRIFTNTLRRLMARIRTEKNALPMEAIMSSLSSEERGVVGQIQTMTGLEPASVVVCTLQLLQSMAPRVFNILGSMDPNFMQSLISGAMAGGGGGGGPSSHGAEGRDVTPPWMRGTKRPGEQPYPEKRGKWN